jgi:hypothetical protein
MEQDADLARLARFAPLPLALLVASGQGRQLRMLAVSTTRRLPSVSLLGSCGIGFWSAGHQRLLSPKK